VAGAADLAMGRQFWKDDPRLGDVVTRNHAVTIATSRS
jgi:hypothetical protein